MAYSQVNPNIERSDINPADRNAMAIAAGYTGYEDYVNNKRSAISSRQQAPLSLGNDFESVLARSQEMLRRANEPVSQSYQAQIPEIQKRFAEQKTYLESQKPPLQQRYEKLLADVKQQGQQQVEKQTLATAQELGRRGILTDTGLGQRELIQATQPIEQKIQSLTKDIGLEREAGLSNISKLISDLAYGETEAVRNVQNAIAQLQSSSDAGAISLAQNIIQQQESRRAREEEAARQAARDALSLRQYEEIALPHSKAQIADIQSQIAKRQSDSSKDESNILDLIFSTKKKVPKNIVTSKSDIKALREQELSTAKALSKRESSLDSLWNKFFGK